MKRTIALGLAVALAIGLQNPRSAAGEGLAIPAPDADENAKGDSEVAVLAGGCFWGVQGVFQHVAGVTRAVSGYAGGEAKSAHYETVGSGATG
ncbi:MAG TPA: peptide-methionine (S)-S-oxide reductase, partial [Methylocystis sp.]|nr:peptide-methionine (S)-S-oxide reductase [Methylocystis sp.]